MGEVNVQPMPPKACLITIMFPVTDDSLALAVKREIDKAVANISEKRYTFQISEQ